MVVEAGLSADIGQKESTIFHGNGGELGWYHDNFVPYAVFAVYGAFYFSTSYKVNSYII